MIRFRCPRCGLLLSAPDECAGRSSRCRCGTPVVIPSANTPPSVEKTSLGQVISQVPTRAPSLAQQAGSPSPVSQTEKTALGKAMAHVPTGLSTKSSRASQPATPVSRASFRRIWLLSLVVFALLLFSSLGMVFFLLRPSGETSSSEETSFAEPLAQLPDKQKQPLPPSSVQESESKQPKNAPVTKGKEQAPPAADAAEAAPANTPEPPRPQDKKEKENTPSGVRKPADSPDIPAALVSLITRLTKGTTEEKIAAAEKLADQGERAAAAAEALCRVAVEPNKEISRAALSALEKVAPSLYEPVFTLLIDGQASNHRRAIASLYRLGPKASAALPVLRHRTRECLEELETDFGRSTLGWSRDTLAQVVTDLLMTMPVVAPQSPEMVQTLIDATAWPKDTGLDDMRKFRLGAQVSFRSLGIGLLSELAATRPEHRKQITTRIVPLLIDSLEAESSQIMSESSEWQTSKHLLLLYDVSLALLQFEPNAQEKIKKKVVPVLREFEFHKDQKIRDAAKTLKKRIETKGSITFRASLHYCSSASESPRCTCTLHSGKDCIIDAYVNNSNHLLLRVNFQNINNSEIILGISSRWPIGTELVRGEATALVSDHHYRKIFPSGASGTYTITVFDPERSRPGIRNLEHRYLLVNVWEQ
jgi:hypothetical protein